MTDDDTTIIHPVPPTHEGDYVTVARYLNFIEARIHWSLLRHEGLDALILDENTGVSYNWHLQAIGGVRLQVPSGQADIAHQILAEVRSGQRIVETGDLLPTAPLPAPGAPLTESEHIGGLFIALTLLGGVLIWLFYG